MIQVQLVLAYAISKVKEYGLHSLDFSAKVFKQVATYRLLWRIG